MRLKHLAILAALIPFYAQADYWKVGNGIADDGSLTASEPLEILKHVAGNHHGVRRAFDLGRSIFDPFGPPMIPADMNVVINGNSPEISVSAQENCTQTVGALQEVIASTPLLQPNTLWVRAKFSLKSENCPSFAQKPYALLEYLLDLKTNAVDDLNLTTYTGPSFEGGRDELFR
jgi:hypothetical protein